MSAVRAHRNPAPPSNANTTTTTTTTNGLTRTEYDLTQTASQPRLPWRWSATKTSALYTSAVRDKWWSDLLAAEANAANANRRRAVSHVARIMETELGERRVGDAACLACRRHGRECWAYSYRGAQQISNSGRACARCRINIEGGGCSLTQRKKSGRKRKRWEEEERCAPPRPLAPLRPRPVPGNEEGR
ncbi:hypothetical protein SLS58_006040 [Diplodia intermedia]|uniref:Zn(2)-C6 fungal-type domain-containing protein n=1 Tax=Diplodia intermedia TaxID=856260 RepID=A0ABR3TPV2_9PEZI